MLFGYTRLIARCVVLTLLLSIGSPAKALALSGAVALPFAASYVAPDGSSYTHRGIDVVLSLGAEVIAPRSGRVRFAGRIPGPHGGSVLAVSLETAEGIITMLPLADIAVATGDDIAEGRRVGDRAETGDPSTSAPHLHLGLKRGTAYVDPTVLLSPATATEGQPQSGPVSSPADSAQSVSAPAEALESAQPAAAPPPSAAGLTQSEAPRGASEQLQAPAAARSASVSSQRVASNVARPRVDAAGSGAGLPAGVTLASAAGGVPAGESAASGPSAESPMPGGPALRGARSRRRLERGALVLAALVAGAACFLVPLLITRRAVARRVTETPVSDRLGTMLQHL